MHYSDIRNDFFLEAMGDHPEDIEYIDALLGVLSTLEGAPLAFRAAAFQAMNREATTDYERTLATFPVPKGEADTALPLAATAFVYSSRDPDQNDLSMLLNEVYAVTTAATVRQFHRANRALDEQPARPSSDLDPSWPVWMTRQLVAGLAEAAPTLTHQTPMASMQKAHDAFLEGKEVNQISTEPVPSMPDASWALLLTAMAVMDSRCPNAVYGSLLLLSEDAIRLHREHYLEP